MDIAKYAVHVSERRPEKKIPVGKKLGRKSGKDLRLILWKAFPTKAWRFYGSKVSTYIY